MAPESLWRLSLDKRRGNWSGAPVVCTGSFSVSSLPSSPRTLTMCASPCPTSTPKHGNQTSPLPSLRNSSCGGYCWVCAGLPRICQPIMYAFPLHISMKSSDLSMWSVTHLNWQSWFPLGCDNNIQKVSIGYSWQFFECIICHQSNFVCTRLSIFESVLGISNPFLWLFCFIFELIWF